MKFHKPQIFSHSFFQRNPTLKTVQRANLYNFTKGFGYVFLGKSENGSLVQDHLDHGASKEPKNPFPECTVIQVILDQ